MHGLQALYFPRRVVRMAGNATGGRDLIVGDIHGHFAKLREALDAVAFDPTKDRLFSVGDLVDRGPQSEEVHEWLAMPWFHAIAGNHELLAVWWADEDIQADFYRQNGGRWNIYGAPADWKKNADAFRKLPIAIELETPKGLVGIVHADCPEGNWALFREKLAMDGPEGHAARMTATWGRERSDGATTGTVKGVRAVVVGHTVKERLTCFDNVHFIDTGGWHRGHFTLLEADTLLPASHPTKALTWA